MFEDFDTKCEWKLHYLHVHRDCACDYDFDCNYDCDCDYDCDCGCDCDSDRECFTVTVAAVTKAADTCVYAAPNWTKSMSYKAVWFVPLAGIIILRAMTITMTVTINVIIHVTMTVTVTRWEICKTDSHPRNHPGLRGAGRRTGLRSDDYDFAIFIELDLHTCTIRYNDFDKNNIIFVTRVT